MRGRRREGKEREIGGSKEREFEAGRRGVREERAEGGKDGGVEEGGRR